jgi:uncharacterized protein (UPF0218 family)
MKTLYLPADVREDLQKPWGISIFGTEEEIRQKYDTIIREKRYDLVITVGDKCSLSLASDIKIFDCKINRKGIEQAIPSGLNVDNPAGTIQEGVWQTVEMAIREKKNICVNGEEDLLVIPVVLLAADNTAVVYGLRGKGICLIEVGTKIKKDFKEIMSRFQVRRSS